MTVQARDDLLQAHLRRATTAEVCLALEQVRTVMGVLAIVAGERATRNRPLILRTAERRLEQLRGSEAPGQRVRIAATGVAVVR